MANKLAYLNGRKKKACPRCHEPLDPIYQRISWINRSGLWTSKMLRIPLYYWCRRHGMQVLLPDRISREN